VVPVRARTERTGERPQSEHQQRWAGVEIELDVYTKHVCCVLCTITVTLLQIMHAVLVSPISTFCATKG
jgi:hypothetical protein